MTQEAYVDSIDQDQITQTVQSDLWSTLSTLSICLKGRIMLYPRLSISNFLCAQLLQFPSELFANCRSESPWCLVVHVTSAFHFKMKRSDCCIRSDDIAYESYASFKWKGYRDTFVESFCLQISWCYNELLQLLIVILIMQLAVLLIYSKHVG